MLRLLLRIGFQTEGHTDVSSLIISHFTAQSRAAAFDLRQPPSLPLSLSPSLRPSLSLSLLPPFPLPLLCAVEQVEAAHLHTQLRAPCYCCRCVTHR